ncbi:fabI [Wigglesworthia glossinidia endosymbiont of Glossina brevipalpis]|uniref:Enoyl-[acyl-carrier-protein] reductase [NADH] n=1 Tax=Wigglesworthia glossinidia brevipalpis TaxID=36870 RepID=Q8D2J2_WIGBR|nr:fabI [Wigglesworthia glossinidia endosymbiont of Glossina brevipalpis]
MGLLKGKKILITGIANKYSISYGIACAMHREKADLAFTYQNEKIKKRVEKFAKETFFSDLIFPCNVNEEKNIYDLFEKLKKIWPKFDGFVHSIAYTNPDQLSGRYLDVINKEGFECSQNISAYSFSSMSKISKSMLNSESSLITITYLGSERVVPYYNTMGIAKASLESSVRYIAHDLGSKNIRVNAISAAPIKTLSSSGIKNFKKMLYLYENVSPLKCKIGISEIGNVAVFLCSNLSSGITGEIIHVDRGFHIMSGSLYDSKI